MTDDSYHMPVWIGISIDISIGISIGIGFSIDKIFSSILSIKSIGKISIGSSLYQCYPDE